MAANGSLLALAVALLVTAGSCSHPGQCNPSKPGCMAPTSSVIKCNHGWCDAARDGWACCAGERMGGRVAGSPDYPFMCAMKLPFQSYGATAAQADILVNDPATGLTVGLSGPNPCGNATMTSDALYNTICEHPIKATPAQCDPFNGMATGILDCGYAGACNPMKTGCTKPDPAYDPMLCGDGTTCVAEHDGWSCCARRLGRASSSPNYPFMCAMMLPFAGYGANPAQVDILETDPVTGLVTGLSGPNPCDADSSICEHPLKHTAQECDPFNNLTAGALKCGYTNSATNTSSATMTCGQVKDAYKAAQCCGQPNSPITLA